MTLESIYSVREDLERPIYFCRECGNSIEASKVETAYRGLEGRSIVVLPKSVQCSCTRSYTYEMLKIHPKDSNVKKERSEE